ncbi:MAG: cupin domain-containing protein [Betaproteobacteria bacterium]|nr:cupin domain-containing protein [Betaproteobacteria bacterium]
MRIHADLTLRAVVHGEQLPWLQSPASGVSRRMLERDGREAARATSIVRYAAGARFDTHVHQLGEEIFVLDGTFCDEHGRYGPGTYLHNPPGSSHAPWSDEGCTLWVKLRHMQSGDLRRGVVDTREARWWPGLVPGLTVMPLHEFASEHTALVRWDPGTRFRSHRHWGGEEIFVLEGVFEDEHGVYPAGTWLRSPHLSEHQPFTQHGCTVLVKTGHLDTAGASLAEAG